MCLAERVGASGLLHYGIQRYYTVCWWLDGMVARWVGGEDQGEYPGEDAEAGLRRPWVIFK